MKLINKLANTIWSHSRNIMIRRHGDVVEYTIPLGDEAPMLGQLIKIDKRDDEIILIYQHKKMNQMAAPKDFLVDFK